MHIEKQIPILKPFPTNLTENSLIIKYQDPSYLFRTSLQILQELGGCKYFQPLFIFHRLH